MTVRHFTPKNPISPKPPIGVGFLSMGWGIGTIIVGILPYFRPFFREPSLI
jgi:hypothetical protein